MLSPALWIVFSFYFTVSFEAQKFFILMKSSLSVFSFVVCDFGIISKKLLPKGHEDLCARSFMVLALTFRSLIHFELIFIYSIR